MRANEEGIDIMCDLETLGTIPGSVILQIALVPFRINGMQIGNPGKESGAVEYKINSLRSQRAGFKVDDATETWWKRQNTDLTAEVFSGTMGPREVFCEVITLDFQMWKKQYKTVRLWGNGSDFDNAMLASVYALFHRSTPWDFYNSRCYRTLKNLFPDVRSDEFIGQKHDALVDAFNQAKHCNKLLNYIKLLEGNCDE